MTSNPCLEYVDVYGRKTDLVHIAKGATYPINILGNAATADVANNPIEDLLPESTDTISFRSGDELDTKANEFTHKISKVDEAIKATNDSEGNNIAETYAKKSEAIALDPETGKVPTEYLPDTANNVNFVNGQTGTVELTAEDIPYNGTKSTRTQMDDIVADTNTAINALNTNKADKTEIPVAGEELYTTSQSGQTHEHYVAFYRSNSLLYYIGTLEQPYSIYGFATATNTRFLKFEDSDVIYMQKKVAGEWEDSFYEVYGFKEVGFTDNDPWRIMDYNETPETRGSRLIVGDSIATLVRCYLTNIKTTETPVINAYKYEADQVGNEFRLIKKNTTDSTEEIVSQFGINANAIFAFAPQAQVFDLTTNLHVRINMDNADVYNMAYLEALDKSTGTWTIHNDGNDRIYVMRFGGRFNSGARISPMPHGEFIDSNATTTFVLDSDDPYLDRNSFGLLVWKLGEQA